MGTASKWVSDPLGAASDTWSSGVDYLKDAYNKNKRLINDVSTGGITELYYGGKRMLNKPYEDATDAANEAKTVEEQNLAAQRQADDNAVLSALDEERKRRARMQGRQSTILAGALGNTASGYANKTLLGG